MDGDFQEINASTTGTKEFKELLESAMIRFFGLEKRTTYLLYRRVSPLEQNAAGFTAEGSRREE